MNREAEAGGFAFVEGDTIHPLTTYLQHWQKVSVESAKEVAQAAATLQYLVQVRESYRKPTRGNPSLTALYVIRFGPVSIDKASDNWLHGWLRKLSFQDFINVCRIGIRLLEKPVCQEVSTQIEQYIEQNRKPVTDEQYLQAKRLLGGKAEAVTLQEFERQWKECKCRRPPFH
jgi:hypothetical protein